MDKSLISIICHTTIIVYIQSLDACVKIFDTVSVYKSKSRKHILTTTKHIDNNDFQSRSQFFSTSKKTHLKEVTKRFSRVVVKEEAERLVLKWFVLLKAKKHVLTDLDRRRDSVKEARFVFGVVILETESEEAIVENENCYNYLAHAGSMLVIYK